MAHEEKNELLRKLEFRERILKGKLQHYVKYRDKLPEGMKYADEQINVCLEELKMIWEIKKELES